MEAADPEFSGKVRPGDILVGLKNFGCGSSREHAPISIKGAGVAAVIAKSFARIFYRNSINLGLPLFETDSAERIQPGDELDLDYATGKIQNLTRSETYQAKGLPEFAQEIMKAGGLMPYIAKKRGLTAPKANTTSVTPAQAGVHQFVTPAKAGVHHMDSRPHPNG
jgi:3-isopropylmalate dehydratase small subunit